MNNEEEIIEYAIIEGKAPEKWKISEQLLPLKLPIESLSLLPGNPKKGNVSAVVESYREFGQIKSIVARKDGDTVVVIAGNTQLQAARELEWTHIATTVVSNWSERKAAAFALADNHTSDMGEYDEDNLLDMMSFVAEDDELFNATSYDVDDYADLMELVDLDDDIGIDEVGELGSVSDPDDSEDDDDDVEPEPRPTPKPVVQFQLVFDDEEQQTKWYSFVRWLKKNIEGQSMAERLINYLESLDYDGES